MRLTPPSSAAEFLAKVHWKDEKGTPWGAPWNLQVGVWGGGVVRANSSEPTILWCEGGIISPSSVVIGFSAGSKVQRQFGFAKPRCTCHVRRCIGNIPRSRCARCRVCAHVRPCPPESQVHCRSIVDSNWFQCRGRLSASKFLNPSTTWGKHVSRAPESAST